eukprot:1608452-Rhodomonas_salina.1
MHGPRVGFDHHQVQACRRVKFADIVPGTPQPISKATFEVFDGQRHRDNVVRCCSLHMKVVAVSLTVDRLSIDSETA